jgi:hypothetical protein
MYIDEYGREKVDERHVTMDADSSTQEYTLRNLVPNSRYQLIVFAHNRAGWSDESSPFVFQTAPGKKALFFVQFNKQGCPRVKVMLHAWLKARSHCAPHRSQSGRSFQAYRPVTSRIPKRKIHYRIADICAFIPTCEKVQNTIPKEWSSLVTYCT